MIKSKGGKRKPIHLQLRAWLLNEIDNYSDGAQLPTEVELAAKHNVSRLTVHKVMNDLQRDGYVRRRAGKGTFVSHGDRKIYTDRVRDSAGSILLAYPDWFSYDIWEKVESTHKLALRHACQVVNYHITRDTMYKSLRSLVEEYEDLKGIILIPPGGPVAEGSLKLFDSFGVPVVLLDALGKISPRFKNIHRVCQDFMKMGYTDISTLCDRGDKRFAYIASEPWGDISKLRLEGMRKALADRGKSRRDLWVPKQHTEPWAHAPTVSYRMTRDMFASFEPDALIFDSLPDAIGGMRAVWERDPELAQNMHVVINAPWFDLERFVWPRPILVFSDVHQVVAEAFAIIQGKSKPGNRSVSVDVTVRDLPPLV